MKIIANKHEQISCIGYLQKRIERLCYHRFVWQWKKSNKRKMKQDELFDHLMPARCSAHKGVIAFRRHGSAEQNGAALLLSNTLLAYLFYCSYLLGDKSWGGGCRSQESVAALGAGRSVTPTFSCSSLCRDAPPFVSSARTRAHEQRASLLLHRYHYECCTVST